MNSKKPKEPGDLAGLLGLPTELLILIRDSLSSTDIKNLRLACTGMGRRTHLDFKRVFLSPNPLNIEVFLEIAKHEHYRDCVKEIVYDDALLRDPPSQSVQHRLKQISAIQTETFVSVEEEQDRLKNANAVKEAQHGLFKKLEDNTKAMMINDAKLQRVCSPRRFTTREHKDWEHAHNLAKQQDSILRGDGKGTRKDLEALRYGLAQFENLEKITITTNTHGELFTPEYETPMIRNFPPEFNYPLPQEEMYGGVRPHHRPPAEAAPVPFPWPTESWNGFCVVTEALAELSTEHKPTTIVVGRSHQEEGLHPRLIAPDSPFYEKFIKLISSPGFRKLHLMLLIDEDESSRLNLFLKTYEEATQAGEVPHQLFAWEAVAKVPAIESMSLRQIPSIWVSNGPVCLPLQLIFPRFTRLKDFRLWNFTVTTRNLIDFLSNMPTSLERVELVALDYLYEPESNDPDPPPEPEYPSGVIKFLLEDMKAKSLWKDWPPNSRPNLRIALHYGSFGDHAYRWLKTEVDAFLHGEGQNPFTGMRMNGSDGRSEIGVNERMGVIVETREPSYEIPAHYCSTVPVVRKWVSEMNEFWTETVREQSDGEQSSSLGQ